MACKMPDGKYNIIPYGGGPVIMTGVDEACFNQFGDITLAQEGDTRCVGFNTGGGAQTGPATGACGLSPDKQFVVCPPSNGITADYYLDARTGQYAPNMTTQSPDCKNAPNVTQVQANSPYCDGGQVWGPGDSFPTLVACHRQAGSSSDPGSYGGFSSTIVDVHGGPDFALLAEAIRFDQIEQRFPGQRWMYVRQERCSPLPDFGVSAPTPAPAPTPTPTPAPTPAPVTKPTPPSLPTQPIGGGIMPMPVQPMPVAQPMARQVPMAPKAAPPPPPAPKPAAKCPPSPAKGAEWWNYCLTNEKVYPVYVEPNTTLETALGIGAVALAAALAVFAIK